MPYCDTQCFIRSMKKSTTRTPADATASSTTDRELESSSIDGVGSAATQVQTAAAAAGTAPVKLRALKDDDDDDERMMTARRTRARKRHGVINDSGRSSTAKTYANADDADEVDDHNGSNELSRASTSPKRSAAAGAAAALPSERFLRNLVQGASEPYSVERRIDLDGLAGKRDCDSCRVKVAQERLNIVCGIVKVHALVCAECADRVESKAKPLRRRARFLFVFARLIAFSRRFSDDSNSASSTRFVIIFVVVDFDFDSDTIVDVDNNTKVTETGNIDHDAPLL
jgi:hypothetical protein